MWFFFLKQSKEGASLPCSAVKMWCVKIWGLSVLALDILSVLRWYFPFQNPEMSNVTSLVKLNLSLHRQNHTHVKSCIF